MAELSTGSALRRLGQLLVCKQRAAYSRKVLRVLFALTVSFKLTVELSAAYPVYDTG